MRPLNTREQGGVLIIKLDDPASLNDGQCEPFRAAVYQLIDELHEGRVALDLSPLDFLSSSGVAFLIGVRRRLAAKNGKVVLYGIQPYILDLLRVMRLNNLFAICDDEASALQLLPPVPVS